MLSSGLARVAYYNWPRYAAAVAVIAAGVLTPVFVPVLRLPAWAGAALAAGWTLSSLVATWWVYDRSPFYTWTWLTGLLPVAPRRYAVISAGLDEISPALARHYPGAAATLLDLYDPARTREGSIRRAQALSPPPPAARHTSPAALPVPDGSLDAVFVAFAAHELRAPADREALFAEIARVLRPGGRLILAEHHRDAANIAAFGPGAWHFYPRREWSRLAAYAGLTPAAESRMTPLVHATAFVGRARHA